MYLLSPHSSPCFLVARLHLQTYARALRLQCVGNHLEEVWRIQSAICPSVWRYSASATKKSSILRGPDIQPGLRWAKFYTLD